jgi:hypothetical protein
MDSGLDLCAGVRPTPHRWCQPAKSNAMLMVKVTPGVVTSPEELPTKVPDVVPRGFCIGEGTEVVERLVSRPGVRVR